MNLKQMHMELAMYRGEAEELSKDAHATKEQIAEKARKAVDTEQRIRLLYATIDAAYKKATNQKLNEDEEALLDGGGRTAADLQACGRVHQGGD